MSVDPLEQERRDKSAREAMLTSDEIKKAAADWRRRWLLSLAIGNGAGAVGLTSAFLNGGAIMFRSPILIGLWFFAVGIVSAGLVPAVQAMAEGERSDIYRFCSDEAAQGGQQVHYPADDFGGDVVFSDDLKDEAWAKVRRYGRWTTWLERGSALAFVLAIVVPLALTTLTVIVGRPLF
jgi:hypothetical protein